MPTSYSDVLGSGNRVYRLLGFSTTGAFTGAGLPTELIDGETTSGFCTFVNGQPASSYEIRFDFRGIVLIDEAKFYQSTSVTHGVWEWQGSNDGTTWTPIGSFVLGGATNPQVHDVWHGNLTPYQHVRLKGLSGTVSTSFLFEIEFRCDHTVGDPETRARSTQDVAEVAIAPALPAVRDTTDAAEIAFERDPQYVLVRDTTDAVEAAIETYPVVRVTQDVIECVITPPRGGGVTIVPPIPLPLQQQVYDERFLMTEPWRGFFTALLKEKPAIAGFMERIGRRWRRRVTQYAEDSGLPDYPLPLQQAVIDERRLVREPWRAFFQALGPKFHTETLPLPVQQAVTDDRHLMTVPWVLWFLWLLNARTEGDGGPPIEEFMPDIVFMDSFDHYATNDLHMKYALHGSDLAYIAPGRGRNGTNALAVAGQNDNANFLRLGRFPARDTYYLEFAFNANTNAGDVPPGNQIAAFRDSGITQVELRLMATGQLSVTRNGTMLGQTSGIAIGTNTWRHLGFYAKISNSLGEVTVTLDSIPVITVTGVDTNTSGFDRITEVVFFSQSNSNAVASYYDDIILSKDGFCSDSRVAAVFPKGNGFWTQWIQCPNAYTYPQGSGNRTADIAITQNATSPLLTTPLSYVVDGNQSSAVTCNGITVDSTKWIRFDFGAVLSRHITEVRLLWGNVRTQGTWLWQGSGDGIGWTDLMTAPVTLGGIGDFSAGGWQTIPLTNGLFYRYYRLRGVDGSPASAGLNTIHEFEFCIDPGTAPPPLYQNVDERDSNEDDDYNYSKTAGHRVSYDFQSLGMTGTIKGVQHVATMRKDDDRVRIVKLFTRIAGTDYDGPDISVNDTYVAQRQVWVKNPATDAPWEVAEVDGAEFGELLVS